MAGVPRTGCAGHEVGHVRQVADDLHPTLLALLHKALGIGVSALLQVGSWGKAFLALVPGPPRQTEMGYFNPFHALWTLHDVT